MKNKQNPNLQEIVNILEVGDKVTVTYNGHTGIKTGTITKSEYNQVSKMLVVDGQWIVRESNGKPHVMLISVVIHEKATPKEEVYEWTEVDISDIKAGDRVRISPEFKKGENWDEGYLVVPHEGSWSKGRFVLERQEGSKNGWWLTSDNTNTKKTSQIKTIFKRSESKFKPFVNCLF